MAILGDVRTIAVIGAGPVGRGIAQLAARGGYRTILEDLLPNPLRRAESEIRIQLDSAVASGGVTADAAKAAFSRLEFAGAVEDAARQADLVIEAVPEELESKIEIFTLLDKICRPGTILASHLSSLSITEISRVTYRARNCLGMHFVEPVHDGKRLEIIRGQETDDDTVATAVEVGRRMGKETVVIEDAASTPT
jgi:3-hydroxybutyryl-CoA dehydrogenase